MTGSVIALNGAATSLSLLAVGARYFVYRFTKMIFAAAQPRVPSLRSG